MRYSYRPRGVCPMEINFDLNGNVVRNIEFTGGCNGNTQGIAGLVKGMKVEDVIARLENVDCGGRGTSCPDQLSKALKEYVDKK